MKQRMNPFRTFITLISIIRQFTDGWERLFDNICKYYRILPIITNIYWYIQLFNHILRKNKQWYVTGHYTVFWNKVHAENTELRKNWLHFARKKGVSPVNSQIVMNWSFLLYMFIWMQFKDRFKERVHIQARPFFKEAALMVNKLTHQIYLLF